MSNPESNAEPPPLATALLRRFLHDEPLAGDLLERYAVKRSRLWFWREVLAAVLMRRHRRADQEHPLGIAGDAALIGAERAQPVVQPRQVNLTASPIPGIGGLGLVVLGGIVAVVRPEVWWMFVPAIVGGAALGLTVALVRRRALLSGPAVRDRTLLQERDERDHTD